MSALGLLAGFGDALHRENEQRDHESRQQKQAFVDTLQRVVDSEDWPEEARMAAAQARLQALGNPKLKPKDFTKLWDSVQQASTRTVDGAQERNAMRMQIPQMQQFIQQLPGMLGAQTDGSTRNLSTPQQQGDGRSMDPGAAALSGSGAPSDSGLGAFDLSFLAPIAPGLQEASQQAAGQWQQSLQQWLQSNGRNTEPVSVSGPYTRGEKSQQALSAWQQQSAMQQQQQLDTYRQQREIDQQYQQPKYSLAADGALVFDPTSGVATPTGYQPPPKPENATETEAAAQDWMAANGLPDTPTNRVKARTAVKQAAAIAVHIPSPPRTPDPTVVLMRNQQATEKYQKQWTDTIAPMREMERQYRIMENGLSRFRKDPNGASQAVLVTFQKILDPTSVVRESEYARSPEGISWLQRMQGTYERIVAGGAGVPESTLREMVQTAKAFLQNMHNFNAGVRGRIMQSVRAYQLDPSQIFPDVNEGEMTEATQWLNQPGWVWQGMKPKPVAPGAPASSDADAAFDRALSALGVQ